MDVLSDARYVQIAISAIQLLNHILSQAAKTLPALPAEFYGALRGSSRGFSAVKTAVFE